MSAFVAIVPMACLVAAAIAAMTAEAFRDPGERVPIAPLGVTGLAGAGLASALLWGHNATSFGVVTAESLTAILDALARGETPKPGPQVKRQTSCPEGGPTTLVEMVEENHDYRGQW